MQTRPLSMECSSMQKANICSSSMHGKPSQPPGPLCTKPKGRCRDVEGTTKGRAGSHMEPFLGLYECQQALWGLLHKLESENPFRIMKLVLAAKRGHGVESRVVDLALGLAVSSSLTTKINFKSNVLDRYWGCVSNSSASFSLDSTTPMLFSFLRGFAID
ncbi:hypothetical protein VNO77_15202 [Canavalia gladiata]|uniref:Uncharacterized protein n=1 Tax=Canavalia gladiata TaxID=3824 RepID=A0AAN9LZB9_CANGL